MTSTAAHPRHDHAPWYVPLLNPISRRVLRAGVSLGPNVLVTVRGRTTGQPRTTPLAIIEADGRRWIWSPWGDVNWVQNLRAAGRATITAKRRSEEVTARELDPAERLAWFRNVLLPTASDMRGGVAFLRIVDGTDMRDPERAADGRVVFELRPAAE
ncbi:MAG TPA: nitroreductase family deazaflavin-dependent oxidoreductase [Candidatus Limnocylindrales bacterium]